MIEYLDLTFIVDPIDEVLEASLFEAGLEVGIARFGAALTMVETTIPASDNPVADAVALADNLQGLGVNLLRLDLDLVNQNAIAARCGVTRAAVSKWVNCSTLAQPFPRPYTAITGPVWAWCDVSQWLGRTVNRSFDGSSSLTSAQVAEFNSRWAGRSQPESATALLGAAAV